MDRLDMRGCGPKITGLCAFILFIMLAPLSAMELKGYADLGLENLKGYTSYEIGGLIAVSGQENRSAHFPFSKLKFPLTGWLVATGVGLTVEDAFQVNLGLKKSIIRDSGRVEDWDWGYWNLAGRPWARAGTLDIYSTSRGSVDAWMGDAKVRWCMSIKDKARPVNIKDAQLKVGVGYMIQVFDYDTVDDLDQWYPSYPLYATEIENDPNISTSLKKAVKGHVYHSGDVLSYHVEYEIPFLEGGVLLGFNEMFRLEASLGYSYWVKAKDTDHHLLRGKVSKGSCDGNAVLFTLNTDFCVTENILLGLNYRRIVIAATGSQHQSAPDFSAAVDQHIESDQQYIGSTIGYRF